MDLPMEGAPQNFRPSVGSWLVHRRTEGAQPPKDGCPARDNAKRLPHDADPPCAREDCTPNIRDEGSPSLIQGLALDTPSGAAGASSRAALREKRQQEDCGQPPEDG